MTDLMSVTPRSPFFYLVFALFVPLAVRIGISAVEAKRLSIGNGFWRVFKGCGSRESNSNEIPADYWLAFALGVTEMLAYPLLIVTHQPLFIGAWLGFKTIHRWQYAPSYPRGLYNRYVLANALILIGAYFSARFAVA